ncbi:MAG: protease modulator HflC [Pseudomonadota bacterium]|nr:protease modulator HflC [Pseudomonadota bacterium]
MKGKTPFLLLALLIIGALVAAAVYTVDEREKALVFRFGEIVRANDEPGLHFKTPFINNVKFFDARVQTMDADPQLYLTREKKNLVVDSFVKWRVRDTASYYTRLGGLQANARTRLAQRVNDSLRQEFGKRSVREVVSGDRAKFMDDVRKGIDEEAAGLGIEVLDVRLKRVDLDPDISERVYARMQAERQRVAKELRAQGEEQAEIIRANADRERAILIADARRDGEQIRGQGDAQATATYAGAYGKDQEFFQLYRSLGAYQGTFQGQNDLFVVDPSSAFFKYFKTPYPTADD